MGTVLLSKASDTLPGIWYTTSRCLRPGF